MEHEAVRFSNGYWIRLLETIRKSRKTLLWETCQVIERLYGYDGLVAVLSEIQQRAIKRNKEKG